MHNYHSEHGRLPPAVVYGKDGRPLQSWRVLILPYMEEGDLYRQFKLDEPWDSLHNIQLLSRMPTVYAPPGSKASLAQPYHTFCRVFIGNGTAFENPQGEQLNSFTDGTSNTILIVEGGKAVLWTQPEELCYAADRPLPILATVFKDSFRVALADGSVRFLKKETSDATLRSLITRNGGEKLEWDWND